jgi:hypothetical protein
MGGVLYSFHLIKESSFVKRNVFTPLKSNTLMVVIVVGNARLPRPRSGLGPDRQAYMRSLQRE